jgi:hypothetical protein
VSDELFMSPKVFLERNKEIVAAVRVLLQDPVSRPSSSTARSPRQYERSWPVCLPPRNAPARSPLRSG